MSRTSDETTTDQTDTSNETDIGGDHTASEGKPAGFDVSEPVVLGSVAQQVVSNVQNGAEHESLVIEDEARREAIDELGRQQRAFRAGVTIIPVESAPPVSAISYSSFARPAEGISAGMMLTWVVPQGVTSHTISADIAIRAIACFRCLLSPARHAEAEILCERCNRGTSSHKKVEGRGLLCADNRPMKAGAMAKAPLCPDGVTGEFHFEVSPESRVIIKNESVPAFRQQADDGGKEGEN